MSDKILATFLNAQYERAMALASASDFLDLTAIREPGLPPDKYIATFACQTALRLGDDTITIAPTRVNIGIFFAADHLRRRPDMSQLVSWLAPGNIVHPNIRAPFVCLGSFDAGITLVDILFQTYEIVSYLKWSPHDALDPIAAQWARNNQQLFPTDRRPLRRRSRSIEVHEQPPVGGSP
jgi:hypothetical protein